MGFTKFESFLNDEKRRLNDIGMIGCWMVKYDMWEEEERNRWKFLESATDTLNYVGSFFFSDPKPKE